MAVPRKNTEHRYNCPGCRGAAFAVPRAYRRPTLMGNGPFVIFDKSAIQSFSLDEAALFGQFYWCNLTPMFFVETLADLEKKVRQGQTPEQVVGTIARKTVNFSADPNADYRRLLLADLMGDSVLMDGRPVVAGGRPVKSRGKRGFVYERSPETEALDRWQRHRFLEIERDIAKHWRESLAKMKIRRLDVRKMFDKETRPRDLKQVHQWAVQFTHETGAAFDEALDVIRIEQKYRPAIIRRFIAAGQPPISTFAPFAAYCVTVTVFFQLAVSLDFISGDRASNVADIGYLYYLPFCFVFTSNDHLHAKTVPLFLRPEQRFIAGTEMKADLKQLDAYFSALPAEVLDRGLMMFDPPDDDKYLTTRLWREFLPGWTPKAPDRPPRQPDPQPDAKLLEEFRAAEKAAATDEHVDTESADFIIIKRGMPVKMGKWRIVAQDVAERSWAAEKNERARDAAERKARDEAGEREENQS